MTHGFCSIFIRNTVKQGQSLTHTVSPEWGLVSAERLLKGRKHFSQCIMVSVAVSKLDKTELLFVQPGAKINRVYYCENVGYSNKVYCRQFAISRTTSSCSSRTERWHTVHTKLSLTCVPLNQKAGRQTVQI